MASPEFQAIMEFVAQVRDLTAAMTQQQQTMVEAMLNNERGGPAAQAQGINEKYYKLHLRAGVARLVVPIQVSNQDGQQSSVPLD